jgi:hypothetical protein
VNEPEPSPARRRWRLLGLAVVAVCVLALAAGTFTLSYPGARATAVNAGVTGEMARVYPGILDAVLLVACAAALSLRGVWRLYAWLVTLVVIGTVAAADTVHALAIALPKRPMEATAAVVPWVVLLVGLSLLDAMVRQGRPSRKAVPPGPGQPGTEAGYRNGVLPSHGATTVPLSALLAHRSVAPPTTAPAAQPAAHPIPPVRSPTGGSSPPRATQPVTQPSAQPAAHPEQPEAGKPAAIPAPTNPEPSPPPLGGRDDPSDADAEPSEPSAFFGRLRKSLSPSGKTGKDGKQAPAEPPASQPAPSEPAPTEPKASEPKADEPEASKEPAGQSPNADNGS